MEAQAKSRFAGIAEEIGDPRLEAVLAEQAESVKNDLHYDAIRDKHARSELRKNLADLKKAAEKCRKALRIRGQQILELPFGVLDRAQGISFKAGRIALRQVIAFCDEALAIIPTKGGAPKKPEHHCAAIIVEAWASTHGRAPSANNENAKDACEGYWRACGGTAGGTARWGWYIKKARADTRRRSWVRDAISRSMSQ